MQQLQVCSGTKFFGNLIGRKRFTHTITILGVLVSFILSAMTLSDVINGAHFNGTLYHWMTVGIMKLEVGFLVDS